MDAINARTRSLFVAICGLLFCVSLSNSVFGQARAAGIHSLSTDNFVVYANNPEWARQVGEAAEAARKDLAMHWLGYQLPQWSKPCRLVVRDHPSRPASGVTNYTLKPEYGAVVDFNMTVEGTRERILDSVLPHEITHTIIASHFAPLGDTVPRWADEGMCTTVEHEAERRKHDAMLIRFLREGKGISFETLFALKEYPADMLPLYAQGYSLTSFLIAQGGPKVFIKFLEHGMSEGDWNGALKTNYGYPLKGKLQTAWNDWVAEGGGDVTRFTASARGVISGDSSAVALASNVVPSQRNPATNTMDNGPRNLVPGNAVQALALQGTNLQASNPNGVNGVRVASAIVPVPEQAALAPIESSMSQLGAIPPRSTDTLQGHSNLKSDNFVPASLREAADLNMQAPAARPSHLNNTMHPSGSYYMQQLQMHANNSQPVEGNSAGGSVQHSVSQPGPLQTIGGGLIYR